MSSRAERRRRTQSGRRKREQIRKDLERFGTDVRMNDADPFGDGDQSPVLGSTDAGEYLEEIHQNAGDFIFDGLPDCSPFGASCVRGDLNNIKEALEQADRTGKPPQELIELLEKRETPMRMSPLMMAAACAGLNGDVRVQQHHLKCVKVLLSYGARPDARDVAGWTVCHYGGGLMATDAYLKALDMCIAATKSSYMFGKEVELRGLQKASMNGRRGIARGYIVTTGRRTVYLLDDRRDIAVKPENMRLVGGSKPPRRMRELYNAHDRLGQVPLHWLIGFDQLDVAKHLVLKHNAALDISFPENDFVSPLKHAIMHLGVRERLEATEGYSNCNVASFIASTARLIARDRQKHVCTQCGQREAENGELQACRRCTVARYCSVECQTAHWDAGHKEECRRMRNEQVVLLSGSYRRPNGVNVGDKFFVKLRAKKEPDRILISDETGAFTTTMRPHHGGFPRLLEAVTAEWATAGLETYMKASFNEIGTCVVYPGITFIKEW